MDRTISTPERPLDGAFIMSVGGTFTIPVRGTVVACAFEWGKVKVGDGVEVVGYSDGFAKTVVAGKYDILKAWKPLEKHLMLVRLEMVVVCCWEVCEGVMSLEGDVWLAGTL